MVPYFFDERVVHVYINLGHFRGPRAELLFGGGPVYLAYLVNLSDGCSVNLTTCLPVSTISGIF